MRVRLNCVLSVCIFHTYVQNQRERNKERKVNATETDEERDRKSERKRGTETKRWRKGKQMRENEPANLRVSQRIPLIRFTDTFKSMMVLSDSECVDAQFFSIVRLNRTNETLKHRRIYEILHSVNAWLRSTFTNILNTHTYMYLYTFNYLIVRNRTTIIMKK